ncbi:hypothetical protein CYMTET_54789 [Cymbomonas tetramitiformis]|uniref:Uncharacterized protein n=1 Tax=Cymbomonas tetramitiformis TaxID=36881 RepID=A0AAE0EP04_9CHLO|nr:hypothetical protein CYMTET_54789 [Cymbomonas tetramitiformis]
MNVVNLSCKRSAMLCERKNHQAPARVRVLTCKAASAPQRAAPSPIVDRRALLSLSTYFASAVLVERASAELAPCSIRVPCTIPPPEDKPRYEMPGPAYSPAKAAEEKFLAKLKAEAEGKTAK